jgi:F420H(2)-dependent quinone reductase
MGRRMGKLQVILLTTQGRKTGRPHTVPLNTLPEDGGFVVVGSNNGSDFDPNWWLNLVANPNATIQVNRRVIPVRMEPITDPTERQRLWDKFVAAIRRYRGYQKGTSRTIPLGLLRPT